MASLTDAANADIKGKAYKLSDKNYNKIAKHINRLGDKTRRQLRSNEKLLERMSDYPNVKTGFMRSKPQDRKEMAELYSKKKYDKLKSSVLWAKMTEKFYDKSDLWGKR